MSDTDAHLAAIAGGDSHAFALWVAAAEPRIRASLYSFAATVDTEAVVQESLLRIWQVAPRFEPDGRPDGLIRLGVRIARNLCLTELRRSRPEGINRAMLEEREDNDGYIAPPDTGLREALGSCLEKLPAKPREAFEARLRAVGQHDKVLAGTVRMRLNTFLQNIHRARLALAECLKRHGFGLEVRP